jgi:hypothetical protein
MGAAQAGQKWASAGSAVPQIAHAAIGGLLRAQRTHAISSLARASDVVVQDPL